MKYIAALLTVYNRREKTTQCLNNLFSQMIPDGYNLDVYLTNDGCTDGTPEAIRDLYPQVHIIDGDGTLYWNRGMWTAWDTASKERDYDYYLWLNDDTFLYDNAITHLLETSARHMEESIIVGATEALDHSCTTYGGRDKNGNILVINGKDQPCATFNGNIVLFPKHVYDRLGNMDNYYRHSAGDTDYGLNATKHSIGIYQVGTYLGACDEHSTLSNWCNPKVPLLKRLKALYKPNGQPPHELYHLESKFYGWHVAVFHYFTTHLHCVFPQFWSLIGKDRVN